MACAGEGADAPPGAGPCRPCPAGDGAATPPRAPPAAEPPAQGAAESPLGRQGAADPLVMYVVLRQDLEWPTGALINQACHAVAAVAWEAREDPESVAYLSEVEGQMTTVTLGAPDGAQLAKLADKLSARGVPFRLWTEQPEHVTSALATWPRRRSAVQKLLKGFKRF
ncbi:unnamed protein product [Prorocentrum cordatum]|uniref:peptidyl-tRNA hydrolase n=1 Tax=Prorocentrum cordatum TaxID=2364126 RepID=A0ABN9W4Z8_9DINO|nr:unnamed protein product [Polarella glacialis]